jgi:quercetin dioxygenase-like cupin family protein
MERRDFLQMCAVAGMDAAVMPLKCETAQSDSHVKMAEGKSQVTPRVIRADQVRSYNMGLGKAHIIVDGERSGGAWWMGQFREDPGLMTSLHVHPHTDEQFYVLDGVLSVYLEGEWHDLEIGELALVPRGTPHAQGNTGNQPVHFLGSGNPAGFEGFFVAVDELLKQLSPSDSQFGIEIGKIQTKHDMKVLGPAPQRP